VVKSVEVSLIRSEEEKQKDEEDEDKDGKNYASKYSAAVAIRANYILTKLRVYQYLSNYQELYTL
jgi:hypothetical protein